ncbi:MAG: hydroxyquinol 1,2-dioxygenase [Gammaproteobacteria bacterium]|nr:hydroxyquinol 1,2-dioxygenase [Gammaproteobacteria bacterium]
MAHAYKTRFGALDDYDKGRVEPVDDDVRHYAFSNCFEIANNSRPYEKVVFGQNQEYVMEVVRAEGDSPWYTCAHDEFALCMDGELEIHLIKPGSSQAVQDAEKEGAVLVEGEPEGAKMGWIKLGRGHQALLPAGSAYQFRSQQPAVIVLQTCKGDLSIERWADICQTA